VAVAARFLLLLLLQLLLQRLYGSVGFVVTLALLLSVADPAVAAAAACAADVPVLQLP
jgi:hypothetical protein